MGPYYWLTFREGYYIIPAINNETKLPSLRFQSLLRVGGLSFVIHNIPENEIELIKYSQIKLLWLVSWYFKMSFIILFLSIFNTSNACTIEICTQGKFQGREALHRSISRVFVLYSCSVGLTSFSGLHFNALKWLTICCKPYKWNDILTLH